MQVIHLWWYLQCVEHRALLMEVPTQLDDPGYGYLYPTWMAT
jgi:hypothetical protein